MMGITRVGVIEESLEYLNEMTEDSGSLVRQEREAMFRLALEVSGHSLLVGWTDWQLELLQIALDLADTAERYQEWEARVSRLIDRQKDGSWSRDYLEERLAMMRYRLILARDGANQAAEYRDSYLKMSSFREMAIRETLEQGRYLKAP